MTDYSHKNAPVHVRFKDDTYQIGVEVDGAFFAFGAVNKATFENDVADAKAEAEASKTAKK